MTKLTEETVSEWCIVIVLATIGGVALGQVAGWLATLVWAW